MKRYGHADANQKAIVESLRALGMGVANLSGVGGGVPDLLVCNRQGQLWLLEVKNPDGYNRVEKSQKAWIQKWPGAVRIVRSVEEALQAVGLVVVS